MPCSRYLFSASAIALALYGFAPAVHAQTLPDSLIADVARSYATIHSIGIEWDIIGDADHDAVASVDYRTAGAAVWTPALPLFRVVYNGSNMFAGSVLFLTPATAYEVRVSLTDPDGGAETRIFPVTTRARPMLRDGGRTWHVMPGAGGGDGSAAAPFRGIPAAAAVAQPGDVFLLHAGEYGGRILFDRAGTADAYIAWKAAGDGDVVMNGVDVAASHVWLEGLTIRDVAIGLRSILGPTNVVIRRSHFVNNHYGIYLAEGGEGWYVADNTIIGDTPYFTEGLSGEGIELNATSGHTVAHNRITNVGDGISTPRRNVDIFGNDIFDTSDDGIEADEGFANVRMWGNRIHNAAHNAISFQPQNNSPWYIIRNQIVGSLEAAFKFRVTDRFVLVNNTIVHWGDAWPGNSMLCCNEGHLLRAFSRNNLWVSIQGGQIWGFDADRADWRTDLDFDGFDYGAATNPFEYGGVVYPDLSSFANATGLETNGRVISKEACFEEFDVPTPAISPVPPQRMTLRDGCNAIDAGARLPNLHDGQIIGGAPDLGAYERGLEPPIYGPRPNPTSTPFGGTPRSLPGVVQAEDFDEGGEGLAYHDTTPANSGNAYRATDVDIQPTSDAGGGYNVGWINVGEWLAYHVTVSTAGEYGLELRVAANGSGGRLHVEFGGVDKTGPLTIPNTGGWQNWTTITAPVTLNAGTQVMRVVVDGAGTVVGNINYVQVAAIPPPPTGSRPYTGTPVPLPGVVEAEHFDHGDADVAYRDVSAGNTGGAYRATDVDLEATTDTGGGYNVGWIAAGEWLVYSVSVPSAGSYRLDLRVASNGDGGRLHVEFDGVDKTGPLTIPNTGGWQRWTTISAPVALAAGGQRMRVVVDAASAAGIVGNLNFVQVVSAEAAPQPTDIVVYANDIPAAALHGTWSKAEDPTSPGTVKLSTTNTGFAAPSAPLAAPTHYVDVPFTPVANVPYTLWLRLKALNDEKWNDAVWVQFSGAYADGTPVFPVNSTSGLLVNLATDSTATSVRNWGWQNGAYWLSQPATFTFPAGGTQTLRIQVREDGVQLDQIVLSPSKYLSSPPGGPTNDATIVAKP
jgi:hypothetical protein